jgi:predicted kinase/GNAT superfamily N-acetyltransferase
MPTIMPTIRPYLDSDWDAVLEICILAFTSVHESFERLLGTDLFALVYPDWKASNKDYLNYLISSDEKDRFLVAEQDGSKQDGSKQDGPRQDGSVVGFIHYSVDSTKQRGTIGINAVHPAHQSQGIGSLMYAHVLQIMRAQGMRYVTVDTGGDPSHAPARRAYEKALFLPIPVVHYFRSLATPQPVAESAPSVVEPETEPENRPKLIIVCGLPGSGKTTHAKAVEQNLHAVRFCADEWMNAIGVNLWESDARQRIEKLQWNIALQVLSLGGNVVIEWGTWARCERDLLRTEARKLGAAVELHFLDAPVDVLFERIRRRNMETPAITVEDVQSWSQMFERPTPDEMALFDSPVPLRRAGGRSVLCVTALREGGCPPEPRKGYWFCPGRPRLHRAGHRN